MKISAAFKDAFRVYGGHFGRTLKFLLVEACMTLAAFTPLLFLTENGTLQYLALLAVPFYSGGKLIGYLGARRIGFLHVDMLDDIQDLLPTRAARAAAERKRKWIPVTPFFANGTNNGLRHTKKELSEMSP